MSVRIVLLAREGPAREHYFRELENLGARVDVVAGPSELVSALKKHEYHGIALDVLTRTKCDSHLQMQMMDIYESFPLVRVKWDVKHDTIRAMINVGFEGDELEYFVNKMCTEFEPRKIRKHNREAIHFNVIVFKDEKFDHQQAEKTITMDFSPGGCRLFSIRDYQKGQKIYIRLQELGAAPEITGTVIWHRPWGKEMKIPGLGIAFDKIPEQQQLIENLI